jgi:hypothetical protein
MDMVYMVLGCNYASYYCSKWRINMHVKMKLNRLLVARSIVSIHAWKGRALRFKYA